MARATQRPRHSTQSPIQPQRWRTVMVPVSNYLASFGDNYCIGCNEPRHALPDGDANQRLRPSPDGPRIGWPGEQGTMPNINGVQSPHFCRALRGMFDVNDSQTVTLASITDGTSNTIAAGEGLPAQRADNNVWEWNSGADGTTVPMNYYSGLSCAQPGGWNATNWARAVPTRTQASRVTTPAAATFCSPTGPSTSSSNRSTCSPIVPSAAAPAVRSSVPTPIDRYAARACFAHHMIVNQAAVGPDSQVRSNRCTMQLPQNEFANTNQDHKTYALPQSDGRRQSVPPAISLMLVVPALLVMASCSNDDGLGNAIPSTAPSPITAIRSRRARSISLRRT